MHQNKKKEVFGLGKVIVPLVYRKLYASFPQLLNLFKIEIMKPKINYSKNISIISLLILMISLSYITYQLSSLNFPNFYTAIDLLDEYLVLLIHLTFLTPALIGLFLNKRIEYSLVIIIGYLIYLLVSIIFYFSLFLSTDPLQSGLLFVFLAIPYSLLFSVYLLKFKKV